MALFNLGCLSYTQNETTLHPSRQSLLLLLSSLCQDPDFPMAGACPSGPVSRNTSLGFHPVDMHLPGLGRGFRHHSSGYCSVGNTLKNSFLHISPAGVSVWLSLFRTFLNDLEETERTIRPLKQASSNWRSQTREPVTACPMDWNFCLSLPNTTLLAAPLGKCVWV